MKKPVVGIIDYTMCNIFSVANACRSVGFETQMVSSLPDFENVDALILPGVGAFNSAMDKIRERGFDKAILKCVERKVPLLGVCLGFQMLFDSSEEHGVNKGLGLLPGQVKEISNENGRKVPHIAWEKCKIRMPHSRVFTGLSDQEYMYFVHAYYVETVGAEHELTTTNYQGLDFCSAIEKDLIFGFQFHPEKSGSEGLKIYANFKNIVNEVNRPKTESYSAQQNG